MFINRKAELGILSNLYETDRAELFVLYGRRRVEKTELLRAFCQDKPHLFFLSLPSARMPSSLPPSPSRSGLSVIQKLRLDFLFHPGMPLSQPWRIFPKNQLLYWMNLPI